MENCFLLPTISELPLPIDKQSFFSNVDSLFIQVKKRHENQQKMSQINNKFIDKQNEDDEIDNFDEQTKFDFYQIYDKNNFQININENYNDNQTKLNQYKNDIHMNYLQNKDLIKFNQNISESHINSIQNNIEIQSNYKQNKNENQRKNIQKNNNENHFDFQHKNSNHFLNDISQIKNENHFNFIQNNSSYFIQQRKSSGSIEKVDHVKGFWNKEEDEKLIAAVSETKPCVWEIVASKVPGRTPIQCKERWLYRLHPNVNKNKFEKWEDDIIIKGLV